MSRFYASRLRRVRDELNAVREAISYVRRHGQQESVLREINAVTQDDLSLADSNAEQTYFIRLYAEFEGILKDHLTTNHSNVNKSEKPKVDWLIRQIVRAEHLAIDPNLRIKMNAVRDFRNSVAHQTSASATSVPFDDALSILNRFVTKLPNPIN